VVILKRGARRAFFFTPDRTVQPAAFQDADPVV